MIELVKLPRARRAMRPGREARWPELKTGFIMGTVQVASPYVAVGCPAVASFRPPSS